MNVYTLHMFNDVYPVAWLWVSFVWQYNVLVESLCIIISSCSHGCKLSLKANCVSEQWNVKPSFTFRSAKFYSGTLLLRPPQNQAEVVLKEGWSWVFGVFFFD